MAAQANEFYTAIGDTTYSGSNCKIQVYFRTSAGNMAVGWVNIADFIGYPRYSWTNYQEPYNCYNSNGSTLVTATSVTINGTGYQQFSPVRSVTVRNPSGSVYTTLNPGDILIATDTSQTG
jgi:hypothetical protein